MPFTVVDCFRQVAAVMGPSGAGKTTFLNALMGTVKYGTISGQVWVNGRAMKMSRLRRIMGFVPQVLQSPFTHQSMHACVCQNFGYFQRRGHVQLWLLPCLRSCRTDAWIAYKILNCAINPPCKAYLALGIVCTKLSCQHHEQWCFAHEHTCAALSSE